MCRRTIFGMLLPLALVGSSACSDVSAPAMCEFQHIAIDWPATMSQNGATRSDSLTAVGANSNYELANGIFEGMRAMLTDGQPSATWNGVSWALPFASDGSIVGF